MLKRMKLKGPMTLAGFGALVWLAANLTALAGEERTGEPPSLANQDTNELALVQGKWYRKVQDGGKTFHFEKEANGNKETTWIYDDAGNLVDSFVVDFKVERQGP